MKLGGGKDWFTAAELADLRLPGMPATKRKVNERARDEAWALRTSPDGVPLARARQGRGGGIEYHRDVLPTAARAMLAARGIEAVADVSASPEPKVAQLWARYEQASAALKAKAKARLGAIQLVEKYVAAGLNKSASVASAAARSSVSSAALWEWLALVDGIHPSDRLAYLTPRQGGGGAPVEIDGDLWQLLISDYLRPECPSFTSCYRRVASIAEARRLPMPIERTLRRRFDKEIPEALIVAKRKGADALRQLLPPQKRSVMDLHAMEAVNIDGHRWDVFVRWPDGRIGRPMMVAIQDLYSRKFLAWRIDESESALSTRLVFADLFANWGIPAKCLMDNGRAFASKTISGGAKSRFRFKIKEDEPTGVLTAFGIEICWALPFRGSSKPIERGFRDFCDSIARHPAFAGAWTGNTIDAKPENYASRAIPLDDFKAVVDAGIAEHNRREGRRTETARGRSFDATFDESYAIAPIGRATPEKLRLALLTAEEVRCDRKTGMITFADNRYWCDALADHAGDKVTIRFDPDNLHGEIHVFTRDDVFIATAACWAPVGFFDKASADARGKQEAKLRATARDLERQHQLLDAATIAALLPTYEDEGPAPSPSVVRPVRARGRATAAAAAVQRRELLDHQAEQAAQRDVMSAGLKRLRLVD